MLSRKEFLEFTLQDPKKRQYKSEAEKRFVRAVEKPAAPPKKLVEIIREYGKYAKTGS